MRRSAKKQKEKIAFQGERGAFSHQAALRFLGEEVDVLPCERFEHVYFALREGKATGAAIPIENTLHGSVHENYDHLLNFDVKIVAETSLRIVHNLIAVPGTRFRDVRRVYSHPVALNQCLKFLAAHTELVRETFYDTAGSVKMLMEKRPEGAAAIASSVAAETYGAAILRRSIEDDRQNYTRFFLLRPQEFVQKAKRDAVKTSVVFSTRNTSGALFRALSALALREISISKIESRPIRGRPWEYLFYLDFLGHLEEPRIENALAHLGEVADFLRVLGSYPTIR